jgi:opacity protein-like surface antigen
VKTVRVAATVVGLGVISPLLLASPAFAQSTTQPSGLLIASNGVGGNQAYSAQSNNFQAEANKRHLGIGLSMSGFIVAGRWEIANGGMLAMDVVWRRALNTQYRMELGGVARFAFTPDAILVGGGVPFRIVLKMDERFEMNLGLELSYTRIHFDLPFFPSRNGMTGTVRWDLGYFLDPKVSIGVTPIGFSAVAGDGVDAFVTYEPGVWARFSPF